jgi:hypothetical protein
MPHCASGPHWSRLSVDRLEDDNGPVDLAGATITIRLKHTSGTVIGPLPCVAEIVMDEEDPSVVIANIKHIWQAGETDVPGVYAVEYPVTYAGGKKETFPSDGGAKLTIKPLKT